MSYKRFKRVCCNDDLKIKAMYTQLEITIEDQGYRCEDGHYVWNIKDLNLDKEMCMKIFYEVFIK